MYKSIKLAMVMAIVLTVSGCVIAVADENDAVEYTELDQNSLDEKLVSETGYQLSGNLILTETITLKMPIIVEGNLDLNVNNKTINYTGTTFVIGSDDTLTISGVSTTYNFDIDGGHLNANSGISITGSMEGGKITIASGSTVTIKNAFTATDGSTIENKGILYIVNPDDGSKSATISGDGRVLEYTVENSKATLSDVTMESDAKNETIMLNSEVDGATIVAIGDYAFEECTGLSTITLTNNGLTSIGDGAFKGCMDLKTANISRVTSIGDKAFEGCVSLATINASSIGHVTSSMFSGCEALSSLTLDTGCTVDANAFEGCTNLTSVKIGDEIYTVENGELGSVVDSIDAHFKIGTRLYITLAQAISASVSGDTIVMTANSETTPVTIDRSELTLDLGTYQLSIVGDSKSYGIAFSGASYTIKNGTIVDERGATDKMGGYVTISVGAAQNLTVTDVEVKIYDAKDDDGTEDVSNNIAYREISGASVILNGKSKIISIPSTGATAGSVGVVVLGTGNMNNLTNLTVTDDVEITVGQYGISGNGTIASEGSPDDYRGTMITLSGNARVTAANGWGIYHPQDGTLNIQDNANVSGLTGIEIRSGTLNMTGGTVESIATESNAFAIDADSGGATTTGVGIAVVQHTTKLNITVDVSGGDVKGYYAVFQEDVAENGDESAQEIDITLRSGNFESTGTDSVTVGDKTYAPSAVYGEQEKDMVVGGNYSSDVSDYVAEGSEIQQNPDGSFVVTSEEDAQLPYPPIWDDDDDYVPPIYVPSQTTDDDDTVKIVACAAAAVVAAIMAAFLVLGNKKD